MRAQLGCLVVLLSSACSAGDAMSTARSEETEPSRTDRPGAGATAGSGEDPLSSTNAPSTDVAGAGAPIDAPPMLNAEGVLAGGCATATVETQLLPTYVLFVLDRSGSMLCNPPPETDSAACEEDPKRDDAMLPSKWEIVEQSLVSALRTLPEDVGVGISYFSNDDDCGVHPTPSVAIAPLAAAQLSAIESSLGAVTPAGGTPIVGATILAYQHMHGLALEGQLQGNKFVVLLTDGQQSEQCRDEARCMTAGECTALLVDQEAVKATQPGVDIRTFVIGAPGSEPARSMLSALALAGGTAPPGCDPAIGGCHFDMTQQADFAAALAEALITISGRAATCELPLPMTDGEELDRERVNIVYSPGDGSAAQVIAQDTRSACDAGADGWQYSADGSKIHLCGPACETVRTDRGSRVDVVLGCHVQGPR